ncbi:MAG: cobalt ECF transporter T component CbiQ [Candidatus Korarchaeota archaeon]|nr:cobalt ECF transporter T component CbiQ [Candidatus Korarchaeota archaeon]NIU84866.1 cobalt ECF transporter T component CbiQ [Candidatus Thorarchaeota archaeon]NIW14903.1 cobalt ECF transporter T component CbiQ [Candidatus Thorarchaeota archaeon]NIW52540.1 cobalt ECF transporter T component CbiQ [Candidatus Korarchaeota archaeon]
MPRILDRTLQGLSHYLEEFLISGQTANKDGFLQHVDPRIKLSGFFTLITATVLSSKVLLSVGLLLFSFFFAFLSKIPLLVHVKRLFYIPLFAFLISVPQVFLMEGSPVLEFKILTITLKGTSEGIHYLIEFTLRVATSISFLSLLLLSTQFSDLMASLKWFRLPTTLIRLFKLTYRYIFLLLREMQRLLLARTARTLKKKGIMEEWRELSQIVGNLLIRTLERGEDTYLSALGRGFTGTYKACPLEFDFQMADILFIFSTVTLTTIVLLATFYPFLLETTVQLILKAFLT